MLRLGGVHVLATAAATQDTREHAWNTEGSQKKVRKKSVNSQANRSLDLTGNATWRVGELPGFFSATAGDIPSVVAPPPPAAAALEDDNSATPEALAPAESGTDEKNTARRRRRRRRRQVCGESGLKM